MSVTLTAKDESFDTNISNGTWRAIVSVGNAYGILEKWNGCHDPKDYTPEELTKIADRIEQLADSPLWLREFAKSGGCSLS